MKEIKLLIEKREDIVFLIQGLNWIRQHNFKETIEEIRLTEKIEGSFINIEERVNINDRLMSMIAQLDKVLEE